MPIDDSASHQLVIEAPSRAPVLITVAGRAVDVRASVARANGSVPAFADAPNRRMGVETLLVEPGHSGRITLQIERNDHAGARGAAEVTARALPLANQSDQRRLEAARNEAFACLAFPNLKRGQESADAFEKAAELHARNDDRRQEGMARLQAAGVRYTRLSDWPGAARLASEAAPLLAHSEAPSYAAFAVRVEGAALDQRASSSSVAAADQTRDLARARERLTEAAEQFQALGNHYEAGYALNYRGVSYDVTGDRDRARKDFLAALDLFRKAADPPAQALSLQSLATQSYLEGRLSDAMSEFDQALALIPRDSDPENFAHTLNNSAWPLRAVGRFDDATARFHEAGEILYRLGDRDGQARALHGLATTLMQTGETDRAKELLLAAIQLRGETGARREQAISLLALGELERRDDKLQDAISQERRALGLIDAPHDVAQGKLFLSRAYRADRQLGLARQQLEDVLRLQLPATHLYRGLALGELGIVESLAGSPDASRAHFDQALAALKANGSDVERARTLVQRAEARLRSDDTAGAVADARTAVVELESIGLQSLQAENRAAFRASYRDAVEVQIGALLKDAETERKKGNDARTQELFRSALVVSDHGRSQLLVGTERFPGMPVSEQVMSRRRQVYESLAGKRQQRERLYGSANPDENRITKLTREIAQLRTEASQLDARVSEHEPALDRRERRRTPVDEAIRSMQDSVVAEYFIGRDHAWLFVLRNGRTAAFRLASAREIEARARKVHSAWRQYNHSSADRLHDAATIASELFRNVPSPAAGGLLYVIPDGVLHVVPMAVFARQAIPGLQPGSVQIATALAAVLDRPPPQDNGERQLLAVVADPVYSADDARLGRGASRLRAVAAEPGLTRYSQVPARVRRLPSTTIEARAIATLAGEAQAPFQLIGPDATRRNVLNARLDRFQIIHFAAHAFADSQDSGLATIALSRFDRDGKPLDGDLRAFDIVQLRLSAELVVLSACNTAVGREIAGEAPLGLSHAFLQSGAQSVVATLWQVPDSSTALLMEAFYRELLVNRRSPAVALELAQDSIRKLSRWSDPYFWAGFQLVSNARFEVGNKNVARREG